ncbi:MAG: arginyltransferase [Alphaproteobacteria bacterium]
MKDGRLDIPQFYLTAPDKCPYLPDQEERKLFAHLSGPMAIDVNDRLNLAGFRRSQTVAYRPACEDCKACRSLRVLADEFKPSRNERRVLARNRDVQVHSFPAQATAEQFELFRHYLETRHADAGMDDMDQADFMAMLENSSVDTQITEYRLLPTDRIPKGRLIGAALCDELFDGQSMVYSFFDPDESERSLGTYMILERILAMQAHHMPHLYLGYSIEECQKMAYKTRFMPHELYIDGDWCRHDTKPATKNTDDPQ